MGTIVENKGVAEIGQLVKYAIDSVTDYMKCKEYEEIEKQRIQDYLKGIIHTIDTNRIIFENYMEKNFADREKHYSELYKLLDRAIEKSDIDVVKLLLTTILAIYNKNPMDGIENRLDSVNMKLLSQNTVKYL